jgi:hypothetical protein
MHAAGAAGVGGGGCSCGTEPAGRARTSVLVAQLRAFEQAHPPPPPPHPDYVAPAGARLLWSAKARISVAVCCGVNDGLNRRDGSPPSAASMASRGSGLLKKTDMATRSCSGNGDPPPPPPPRPAPTPAHASGTRFSPPGAVAVIMPAGARGVRKQRWRGTGRISRSYPPPPSSSCGRHSRGHKARLIGSGGGGRREEAST